LFRAGSAVDRRALDNSRQERTQDVGCNRKSLDLQLPDSAGKHCWLQRILALTAVIWHNDHTGQPTARSLLAYDH
jgi:hypothetical protein